MKYLLMIHMNPAAFEELPEEERNAILDGQVPFMEMIRESGELVLTQALADPSNSQVVRVRDGVPAVTDGPYLEAKEFLAGYYLVDCESMERAVELAGMMPEARYQGVEVRPIMYEAGLEM